jgi:hypothetical protein
MAVTISGTQVTFNDGTVQTTEATLLSAVQYTGYTAGNYYGRQTYSTSAIDDMAFNDDGPTPSSSSSVLCGFQAYRSAVVSIGNDSSQDAGTIQRRTVYRSVGGA